MAKPIWSGAISFGLVNVPVKLFTAVRRQDIRFHQLHAKDGVRIQQRRVCPEDGQEVPWEELVRGYEVSPGQHVVIEPDELEGLDPEASHAVDVLDFVALDQIDPLYFDTSYYLVPDPGGAKAYRLLLDAMTQAGKVGIGKVVLRTKEYLCAVRPLGDALVLTTMNFADEVLPREELGGLPGPDVKAAERELRMADQLIESLSTDFDPTRYEDTHRQAVLRLIEAKVAGQELVVEPAAPRAPVIDLMAALEASLAATKEAGGRERGRGGRGRK
ncbi:MAG: Ku protein, partial [Acidimicrobiales bacterium]